MPTTQALATPAGPVTALIGDLVASRSIPVAERGRVQQDLQALLEWLNRRYRKAILAEFVITIGDEFQALLRDPSVTPDLIWDIEARLPELQTRLGIGFGKLHTALRPTAIGMDGPAFHTAREAIELAAKKRWLGGVFRGFGQDADVILNGFARLLHHQRSGMTKRQRQVAALLRAGRIQTDAARSLGITKQSVRDHVAALGWESYSAGEAGWRAALDMFGYNTARRLTS